ncbi:MAG: Diaminopimelate decarboxylase, partial [Alphaproteobacteria bacterium MarineAlpha8_Bin1]
MVNKISELPQILSYNGNELFIDSFSCRKIAAEFGTPIFCYSITQVEKNFLELKNSFKKISPLICYAVKANFNKNIIKLLAKNGAGADVVSIGELKHCLKYGINPNKIVFSGVGKTNEELEFAIKKNIKQIIKEREEELDDIIKICKVNKLKKKTKISVR